MPGYFIGLDLGTTNTKAVGLSPDLKLLATASAPNRMFSQEAGSGTQDPREVWMGAVRALAQLAQTLKPTDALGICLSAAMHTVFPADSASLEPLLPALTMADVRAGETALRLRRECDAHALYLRTGCPLEYLYLPAKIRRWLEERPELRRARFSAVKDYVTYRLTGAWLSDVGLVSGSGLLDIRRCDYDAEALELCGIQANQLPELVFPLTRVGGLTPEAARLSGLPAGLPVYAGAGDGGLANLGAGVVRPGQTVITVGTSGAVRRILRQPLFDARERTWCYLLGPGQWYHGGATNNAGLAVQWVRERFYPDLAGDAGFAQLFRDAAEVPPGADGVVFAPHFAGERNPHWDAGARGGLHGLGLEHDRRQVARAVLEGAVFCLADIWEAMGGNEPAGAVTRVNGMINSQPVWAQILCDTLGVPLEGVEGANASAVGAAMLGFTALDRGLTLEGLAALCRPEANFRPDLQRTTLYQGLHRKFKAVYAFGKTLRGAN